LLLPPAAAAAAAAAVPLLQSCTKGLKSNPGSTSFSDCKNPAGFSYSSEGANQCPDNHYATKGKMVSREPPAAALSELQWLQNEQH
jgi:hypothetical protein